MPSERKISKPFLFFSFKHTGSLSDELHTFFKSTNLKHTEWYTESLHIWSENLLRRVAISCFYLRTNSTRFNESVVADHHSSTSRYKFNGSQEAKFSQTIIVVSFLFGWLVLLLLFIFVSVWYFFPTFNISVKYFTTDYWKESITGKPKALV